MKWDEMWNDICFFAIIELIVLIALNGKPLLLFLLLRFFSKMGIFSIKAPFQVNGTYSS